MSVEAISDTIHENMYEKMNASPDSEEETKVKHVDRKKTIRNPKKKNQTNSERSIVSDAAHRPGTNNMIARQKQRNV